MRRIKWKFARGLAASIAAVALAGSVVHASEGPSSIHSAWVYPGPDGKLIYAKDVQGNTVPDFSYAGYEGGGVRIPDAAMKIALDPDPQSQDDAGRIQSAIDQISHLPPDSQGL